MPNPWYLVSYDIHHPKRLQQTQRMLKQRAHPLLESLFAFNGDANALAQLRLALEHHTHPRDDDVLLYRLRHDKPIDRWGTACLPEGLYDFCLPPIRDHRLSAEQGLEYWSNFTQLSG